MRIILFLILLLAVLLIIALSDEIISKKSKGVILVVLVLISGGVYFFSQSAQNSQNESTELLLAYEQGKSLKCGALEVNASNFNFEYGTQSFVAKKGEKAFAGQIIAIKNCEIKEQ